MQSSGDGGRCDRILGGGLQFYGTTPTSRFKYIYIYFFLFFLFSPLFGEDDTHLTTAHIFQRGWGLLATTTSEKLDF